jgi:signal transduction histidine kinase
VRAGQLEVEVADDGCGGADPKKGTGLHGLEERLNALDGKLSIESPPGEGTRLLARIPLPKPTARDSDGAPKKE